MAKSRSRKQTFYFVLVLDGFSKPTAEIEDALYVAGCDDAMLSFRGTTPFLEFDRKDRTLEDAVASAIQDVQVANIGVTVLRVEPDDLVSASEIARRTGTAREAVRLWFEGERGPGSFPPPVASVGPKTLLWSWAEVAAWLWKHGKLESRAVVEEAQTLAAINAVLSQERYRPVLSAAENNVRDLLVKTGNLKRLRKVGLSDKDAKIGGG